jgi:hypothetical protein
MVVVLFIGVRSDRSVADQQVWAEREKKWHAPLAPAENNTGTTR